MKDGDCYLCGTQMSSSYFKRAAINREPLIIEVCPECYIKFTFGTTEEKKDYILRKELSMRGIRL